MPGRIVDSDMHDVARFLNRLLGLPPDIQNKYVVYTGKKYTITEFLSVPTNKNYLHNKLLLGVCRLFELFTSTLDVVLHKARNEGQYDSGIVDIKANKIEMHRPPKVTFFFWRDISP